MPQPPVEAAAFAGQRYEIVLQRDNETCTIRINERGDVASVTFASTTDELNAYEAEALAAQYQLSQGWQFVRRVLAA